MTSQEVRLELVKAILQAEAGRQYRVIESTPRHAEAADPYARVREQVDALEKIVGPGAPAIEAGRSPAPAV